MITKLSRSACQELQWWATNITQSHNEPQLTITSDASLKGWGAECEGVSTGGSWTALEATNHINYLEMMAAFLGLKTFGQTNCNTHIRMMTDNTAALNIINLTKWVVVILTNVTILSKNCANGALLNRYGLVQPIFQVPLTLLLILNRDT